MKVLLKCSLFIVLALASYYSVKHEAWAYKSAGKYEGVILQKAATAGRSRAYYLKVKYDFGPTNVIIVHPIDYQDANIGDRWVTTVRYLPILGLSGKAYRPNLNGEPSFIMSLGYVSLKVFLIGYLFFYLGMLLWAVCRD